MSAGFLIFCTKEFCFCTNFLRKVCRHFCERAVVLSVYIRNLFALLALHALRGVFSSLCSLLLNWCDTVRFTVSGRMSEGCEGLKRYSFVFLIGFMSGILSFGLGNHKGDCSDGKQDSHNDIGGERFTKDNRSDQNGCYRLEYPKNGGFGCSDVSCGNC